jgi:hypothetical protein
MPTQPKPTTSLVRTAMVTAIASAISTDLPNGWISPFGGAFNYSANRTQPTPLRSATGKDIEFNQRHPISVGKQRLRAPAGYRKKAHAKATNYKGGRR